MSTTPEYLLPIIRRVCANCDWQLITCAESGVTVDAFADRVAARLQTWQEAGEHAEITEALVERAVINEYCRLLYHAIGLERSAAQQRALDEVWNYVTPIIRRLLPDVGEAAACANSVLLMVWRKRGDVRDPGSFLAWTAMIAGRAALAMAKNATGRELVFSDLFDDDEAEDDREWGETRASAAATPAGTLSAFTAVEDGETAALLADLIRHCLRRMRSGAEVVIRLVLHEQPVSEVSRELALSATNIYVIKTRALARLRRCEALLAALSKTLAPAERNLYGGSR